MKKNIRCLVIIIILGVKMYYCLNILCILQVIFLAVTTSSLINGKITKTDPKAEDPIIILTDKVIIPQNETNAALRKNSNTTIAHENETVVKYDKLNTSRKPKIRQVSQNVPVTSDLLNGMNTDQPYYQSPLMMYPFPMMNTYYPRYFPYGPYSYLGYRGYGYPYKS